MPLKAYLEKGRIEAGCDEVGRGCLAGPVVAAAVVLPDDFNDPGLDDSKKLPEKVRKAFAKHIAQHALEYAIAEVSPARIDEINILQASFEAMHLALQQLQAQPEHLLIDGNRFKPYNGTPFTCVVKGDSKYLSIAAASILAKTYRDDLMKTLHEAFPHYAWNTNVGYPTPPHRRGLKEYGVTIHHRKSFNLFGSGQMSMFEENR